MKNWQRRIAAVLATCCPLVAFVACSQSDSDTPCPSLCQSMQPTELDLSCAPSKVTSATLTGPCTPEPTDGAPTGQTGSRAVGFYCNQAHENAFADCSVVFFGATEEGDCHVSLAFADGFTFETDVHYAGQTQCSCSVPVLVPSPAKIAVNNPASSCGDADAD